MGFSPSCRLLVRVPPWAGPVSSAGQVWACEVLADHRLVALSSLPSAELLVSTPLYFPEFPFPSVWKKIYTNENFRVLSPVGYLVGTALVENCI